MLKIWVDADACPKVIKEILYRAAIRASVQTTFVANRYLDVPRSGFIKTIKVNAGFDVADDKIVSMIEKGDLVITGDIPLAYEVVKKGAIALNPRGQEYTDRNIQSALATRDLMEQLRDIGTVSGGPGAMSKRDRQSFANHLDRLITQNQ